MYRAAVWERTLSFSEFGRNKAARKGREPVHGRNRRGLIRGQSLRSESKSASAG